MARPRAGIVYVGLKAMVAALDRRTGAEVWRTPLKGGVGRSNSFVTLHRDGDILYAGVGGRGVGPRPKEWSSRLAQPSQRVWLRHPEHTRRQRRRAQQRAARRCGRLPASGRRCGERGDVGWFLGSESEFHCYVACNVTMKFDSDPLRILEALAIAACERKSATLTSHGSVSAPPRVAISEVMANPRAVADDRGEWLELHNLEQRAVDIRGWTLRSKNDRGVTIERVW